MKKNLLILFVFVIAASASFFYFSSDEDDLLTIDDYISWKIEQKKYKKPSNGYPDKAMEWYIEQRTYPFGTFPEKWREKAIAHIQKENGKNSLSKANVVLIWNQAGPGNIGGRVRSIVVHPTNPDIVYAGAVGGGVWKTTNGGSSWTALKDNMENLAVCALVIDPDNPDVIYAGTGEGFFNVDAIRGEGIFKSTDAGATWTRLASTFNSDFYYVNKLVWDNSTNSLWAGTRSGLFVSTNGGESFTEKVSASDGCSDVEVAYTNPSTIYAAFGLFNQSSIWRSTNAGLTFSENESQQGKGRIELAVSPSNPSKVYASFMNLNSNGVDLIKYTTNSGNNWNDSQRPTNTYSGADNYAGAQGWYNNILAVDPEDPDKVFAGGIDLWKSNNGGNDWSQKSNWYEALGAPQYIHADFHSIVFAPSDYNIMYCGNDGGIYKSTNRGETWFAVNNGLYITQFYYGAVAPSGSKFYGGTQDNGTLGTNGSHNWSTILGGDGGATEIDFNNPNVIYMEYVNFAFFKSTDGGSSFQKKMNGIPVGQDFWSGTTDKTLFISPFSMDPNNSNTIVAGTYRVWKTTNGAENWTAISGDLTNGTSISKISTVITAKGNSNVIYAGLTTGGIQVTTDNGGNWNLRNSGLPNAYCTRIAIDPDNPAVAYATYSGFSSGEKVYKTLNYGMNWSNISGNLPNIPVNCILVHPTDDNILFIGTDLGVFSTENGGTTWVQNNFGLANVSVHDLDYRASDNKIFAATHGRSFYYADLSGGGGGGNQVTLIDENFDNTFPPNGWSTIVTNAENTWVSGNPNLNNYNTIDPSSINSAICPWKDEDQNEWLISPSFSLGNGNASLEFYAAHSTNFLNNATLKVHISTNGGNDWTQLWEAQNDGLHFRWRQVTLDLTPFSNKENLKLAWQYVGNDGDLVGIDGLKLVGFQFTTGVKNISNNIPDKFEISQNYPNPFNPATTIRYAIPESKNVSIVIYDVTGRKVRELVNNFQNAGTYEIEWNGKNDNGIQAATGTYIYMMKAGEISISKKMLLIK